MTDLRAPQVQIALLGLSASHRDLLAALFHDPGVYVRWVYTADPESALGRLARLFGFPLAIDPSEGVLAGIEILIRPEDDPGAWGGEVPEGVLVITDRELAGAWEERGFVWEPFLERATDPQAAAAQDLPGAAPILVGPLPGGSAGQPDDRRGGGGPGGGRQGSRRRNLPEEFPAWLPRLLAPHGLGGWLCDRIDAALDARWPSMLIFTHGRSYLGAFRGGHRRRSAPFERSARHLVSQIALQSGSAPRSDEPGGGPSIVNLGRGATVLLERCGLGSGGAVGISLPIGRGEQVWLLIPKVSADGREPVPQTPVSKARLVLTAEREGLALLARLLVLHDRARRWQLLRRMWQRLSNGMGPGVP